MQYLITEYDIINIAYYCIVCFSQNLVTKLDLQNFHTLVDIEYKYLSMTNLIKLKLCIDLCVTSKPVKAPLPRWSSLARIHKVHNFKQSIAYWTFNKIVQIMTLRV